MQITHKIKNYHKNHPITNIKDLAEAINIPSDEIRSNISIKAGQCAICGEWSAVLIDDICNNWTCRRFIYASDSEEKLWTNLI